MKIWMLRMETKKKKSKVIYEGRGQETGESDA